MHGKWGLHSYTHPTVQQFTRAERQLLLSSDFVKLESQIDKDIQVVNQILKNKVSQVFVFFFALGRGGGGVGVGCAEAKGWKVDVELCSLREILIARPGNQIPGPGRVPSSSHHKCRQSIIKTSYVMAKLVRLPAFT